MADEIELSRNDWPEREDIYLERDQVLEMLS
jgi:hypothetical protein